MPSARSGQAGNIVPPTDPQDPVEADVADPGESAQNRAAQAESESGGPGSSSSQEAEPHRAPADAEERRTRTSWVEIELVDESGNPVPGEPYRITLPDNSVADGTLSERGVARVEGFESGSCKASFTNLDQDAWSRSAPPPASSAPARAGRGPPRPASSSSSSSGGSSPEAAAEPAGAPAEPAAQPVGAGDYVVQSGDCMSSIADAHGHFWQTIWNDPANAQLKQVREDPNVLLAGDQVTIPPLRIKEESVPAEQRTRFYRRGVPAKLHLALNVDGRAMANESVEVDVDGRTKRMTTDAEGSLLLDVPPGARRGWIRFRGRMMPLSFGTLDPIESPSGQLARLNQLGFISPASAGDDGARLRAGLRAFQRAAGLSESGVADQATRTRLEESYGG